VGWAVDPDAVLTVAGGRRPRRKWLLGTSWNRADSRAGVRLTELVLEPRDDSTGEIELGARGEWTDGP